MLLCHLSAGTRHRRRPVSSRKEGRAWPGRAGGRFPQGPAPGLLFTGRIQALSLQGESSSHPPNGASLFREEERGGPVQEKTGWGTGNQPVGVGWESEAWDVPVGCKGVLQPPWPLRTRGLRPGDHRVLVEGAEPPCPPPMPSVLCQWGRPREVPEKPERRGGHPEIFQKLLPRVHIGLPLRQTHQ